MKINKLKITNFKSIDTLTLTSPNNFSIFAGANGSGKTNIFQALDFVGKISHQGLSKTLSEFGGYENVHSYKNKTSSKEAAFFIFEIDVSIEKKTYYYALKVQIFPETNIIEETIKADSDILFQRNKDGSISFQSLSSGPMSLPFDSDKSLLSFLGENDCFKKLISNIKTLRVDPLNAKQPSSSDHDSTTLNEHASNIAAVLSRILKEKPEIADEILELITLIVPNLEKIEAQSQKIDNKTGLLFKEKGTAKQFPAHLISDGTIYALAQIIMVLDRKPYSWLLIEEPERGIHPQAIQELIELMREEADDSLIWINTHSESVVRVSQAAELLLVDKKNGKTHITHAKKISPPLSMSDAWLSNVFKSGLPW